MLGRSAFGNHSFILGLANYSPWAKLRQMPIFANKVLLWRSQTLSLAYCHWLLSCEEELNNCNRDCMALEVENIYSPILYSSANSWSSPTYHQTLKSFPHLCLSTLECTLWQVPHYHIGHSTPVWTLIMKFQLVEVFLGLIIHCLSYTFRLPVICKLGSYAISFLIQVTDKNIWLDRAVRGCRTPLSRQTAF